MRSSSMLYEAAHEESDEFWNEFVLTTIEEWQIRAHSELDPRVAFDTTPTSCGVYESAKQQLQLALSSASTGPVHVVLLLNATANTILRVITTKAPEIVTASPTGSTMLDLIVGVLFYLFVGCSPLSMPSLYNMLDAWITTTAAQQSVRRLILRGE